MTTPDPSTSSQSMSAKIEAGNHDRPKEPNRSYPRVIEVIRGLGLGGAETLLALRLTGRRNRAGTLDAEVISTSPTQSHYIPRLVSAHVKLTTTDSDSPFWSGFQLAMMCVRDRDRGERIYVAHSPGPLYFLKLLKFLGLLRSPLIQVVHSANYRFHYRVLNKLTNWLSTGGIAVSQEVRRSAGCAGLRTCVTVYGGVDTGEMARFVRESPGHREEFRRKLQVPPDVTLLTSVGSLLARKGHADLVRALARSGSESHLAIVGKGPEFQNLKRLTSELRLSDRVHFIGQYTPGWHWMLASDGLCHTSHAEGLPVVLMESLALGVPVLATDFSGAVEAAEMSPGLLTVVPTGAIDAIAGAITKIVPLLTSEFDRLRILETTTWSVDRYRQDFQQAVESIVARDCAKR